MALPFALSVKYLGTTFRAREAGDRMIEVMYVLATMKVGGPEESVLTLCNTRTEEANASSVLVFNRKPTASDASITGDFRQAGVPIYIKQGVDVDSTSTIKILRNADIVNINCFEYGIYEGQIHDIVQRVGIPYLVTIREKARLPDFGCSKICVSKSVYDIQPDKANCEVIYNSVCFDKFNFKPKPRREKVVLTRICRPEKCAPHFWLIMDRILEDHPNVELWIVGSNGPSTHRVKYLGVRRDIPNILAQTDIFVYTPHPNKGAHDRVIIEAMAMGDTGQRIFMVTILF